VFVGLNVTLTVHEEPTAKLAPQVRFGVYGPAVVMADMAKGLPPEL